MSHWLDEAARGLAEGTHSRRQVLRRGSAIAASALVGSLARPAGVFAAVTSCKRLPCRKGLDCCHGRDCYLKGTEKCCADGHICPPYGECCGKRCCDRGHLGEHCCDGRCIPRDYHCCRSTQAVGPQEPCAPHNKCCRSEFNADCYTPSFEKCCTSGTGYSFVCLKDEECCGTSHCCDTHRGETCCDETCCKKGEHCCGGKTCCPAGKCHDGVCHRGCGPGGTCPKGQFCCGVGLKSERCIPETQTCCAPYCGDAGALAPCGQAFNGGCCPVGQCCTTCFTSGAPRSYRCCPEVVQGKPLLGCCGTNCCPQGMSNCGPGNTCSQ